MIEHPNGTTKNLTTHHNYNVASGLPSVGKDGNGYHIFVELPNEMYFDSSPTQGEDYLANCVPKLGQCRRHGGDDVVSKCFIDPAGRLTEQSNTRHQDEGLRAQSRSKAA